jgi:hypothetical protein
MDGGRADYAGAVICPRAITAFRLAVGALEKRVIARKAGSYSVLSEFVRRARRP